MRWLSSYSTHPSVLGPVRRRANAVYAIDFGGIAPLLQAHTLCHTMSVFSQDTQRDPHAQPELQQRLAIATVSNEKSDREVEAS